MKRILSLVASLFLALTVTSFAQEAPSNQDISNRVDNYVYVKPTLEINTFAAENYKEDTANKVEGYEYKKPDLETQTFTQPNHTEQLGNKID